MARPKEKSMLQVVLGSGVGNLKEIMSQAFLERSQRESEKLRLKIARELIDDMNSLFESEVHSDVSFTSGKYNVPGHLCIIKTRCRGYWQDDWVSVETDEDGRDVKVIKMSGPSESQMQSFLRQLYSVNDSALLVEESLSWFPNSELFDVMYESEEDYCGIPYDSSQPSPKDPGTDGLHTLESECQKCGANLVQESTTFYGSTNEHICVDGNFHIHAPYNKKEKDLVHSQNQTIVCCPTVEEEEEDEHWEENSAGLVKNIETCTTVSPSNVENVLIRENPHPLEIEGCTFDDNCKTMHAGETKEGIFENNVDSLDSKAKEIVASVMDSAKNMLCATSCDTIDTSTNQPSTISTDSLLENADGCDTINCSTNQASTMSTDSLLENIDGCETTYCSTNQQSSMSTDSLLENADGCEQLLPSVSLGCPLENLREIQSHSMCLQESRGFGESAVNETLHGVWVGIDTNHSKECDFYSSDSGSKSTSNSLKLASSVQSSNSYDDRIFHQSVSSDASQTAQDTQKKRAVVRRKHKYVSSPDKESDSSELDVKSYGHPISATFAEFCVPYETCNMLGHDMLQMYLQNTACDCCLTVEGTEFLAHKCVLAARSIYFAAMFGGHWCESEMESIRLEGVKAKAVEQLLLFLYGGVMDLDLSIDIMDMFVVADMYGIESLKSLLVLYVRRDLCHFFHRPCARCINTASQALNLFHTFQIEEFLDRCLKWIQKSFAKFWCTKSFASLPDAQHQLSLQAIQNEMSDQNVLDLIMECHKLLVSLPRIKWTESILCRTTQLMDSAIEFTSKNFVRVIGTTQFLNWGQVASWKAGTLEEIFNMVIDSLPVDTALSVYQTLIDLKAKQANLESTEQDVLDLLDSMIKRCEHFLKTNIYLVAKSKQWQTIDKSLQVQVLKNSSFFHLDYHPDAKPKTTRPAVSSSLRSRPSPPPSAPSQKQVDTSSLPTNQRTSATPAASRQTRLRSTPTEAKAVPSPKPKPSTSTMRPMRQAAASSSASSSEGLCASPGTSSPSGYKKQASHSTQEHRPANRQTQTSTKTIKSTEAQSSLPKRYPRKTPPESPGSSTNSRNSASRQPPKSNASASRAKRTVQESKSRMNVLDEFPPRTKTSSNPKVSAPNASLKSNKTGRGKATVPMKSENAETNASCMQINSGHSEIPLQESLGSCENEVVQTQKPGEWKLEDNQQKPSKDPISASNTINHLNDGTTQVDQEFSKVNPKEDKDVNDSCHVIQNPEPQGYGKDGENVSLDGKMGIHSESCVTELNEDDRNISEHDVFDRHGNFQQGQRSMWEAEVGGGKNISFQQQEEQDISEQNSEQRHSSDLPKQVVDIDVVLQSGHRDMFEQDIGSRSNHSELGPHNSSEPVIDCCKEGDQLEDSHLSEQDIGRRSNHSEQGPHNSSESVVGCEEGDQSEDSHLSEQILEKKNSLGQGQPSEIEENGDDDRNE